MGQESSECSSVVEAYEISDCFFICEEDAVSVEGTEGRQSGVRLCDIYLFFVVLMFLLY